MRLKDGYHCARCWSDPRSAFVGTGVHMLHSDACDLLPIRLVEAHQGTNSDSPVSYCDLRVGCA